MTTESKLVIKDWIAWLIANFLGYALWFGLCAFPLVVTGDRDSDSTVLLFLSSQAAIVGLAQWYVIREHLRQAGWWVLATAIGWPVGLWIGITFMNKGSIVGGSASIVWIAIGITLGLTQWLVLWNKVWHAEAWILVSIALWGASGLLGDKTTELINGSSLSVTSSASLAGILTTWASAECTRGLALMWLLRKPATTKARAHVISSSVQSQ